MRPISLVFVVSFSQTRDPRVIQSMLLPPRRPVPPYPILSHLISSYSIDTPMFCHRSPLWCSALINSGRRTPLRDEQVPCFRALGTAGAKGYQVGNASARAMSQGEGREDSARSLALLLYVGLRAFSSITSAWICSV